MEHVTMEIVVKDGQRHAHYNMSEQISTVAVTMMGNNAALPHIIERIENMIRAMFPNTTGMGRSTLTGLNNLGLAAPFSRTNEWNKTGVWRTGTWEVRYETAGND